MGYTPRIAIVGCGAIAERYHLPALAENRSVLANLVLVDTNRVRLEKLASKFNVRHTLQDYHEILNEVDGVIVALPHYHHYKVAMEFLVRKVHVLCEKPLAETSVEAREMVMQAKKSGVTISVNHTRRLFPAYAKIKQLISEGVIGKLTSIKYIDGQMFSWPTVSGFYFNKSSPKGVLFDRGIHSLDTVCWWLGGKPKVIYSKNDSFGGVEGVALVKLLHKDCDIEIKLSWLNRLQNTYAVVGELGKIEGGIEEWDTVTIKLTSGETTTIRLNTKEKTYNDFGNMMIANFIDVVANGGEPIVAGSEVISSIELMEDCYTAVTRFSMPWLESLEIINDR